jgi:hypothetical protein
MTCPSPRSRALTIALALVAALSCTLLWGVLHAGAAQAADVHTFLPGPTKAISKSASTCTGPGKVTGPLGEVSGLTVSLEKPGESDLWLAEKQSEPHTAEEIGRIEELGADTSECIQQLELPASLDPSYQFERIAVGHSTGEREVYVSSVNRGAVGAFGPSGALQVWTGANTPGGSFAASGGVPDTNVTDVAVDETAGSWESGDVFVSTSAPEGGVVDVFKPETALKGKEPASVVAQVTGTCGNVNEIAVGSMPCPGSSVVPFEGGVASIAVDPGNGDLLVGESGRYMLDVFEPTGIDEYEFVRQISETTSGHPLAAEIEAVAAGGGVGDGDIYIGQTSSQEATVDQFNAEGVFLGSLTGTPAAPFLNVHSVAVYPVSHDVLVGDGRLGDSEPGVVDVFGPDVVVPNVSTEAASGETPRSATLNGRVSPLKSETNEDATCLFLWGTSEALGEEVHCEQASLTAEESPVTAKLERLKPDTTYYYRLQASNAKGTSTTGEVLHFTTPGPGIVQASVSDVKATSATLDATLEPHGVATTYRFEYDTRQYGEGEAPHGTQVPVPDESIGSLPGEVQVSRHVQGLSAGTTYYYRVVTVGEIEISHDVLEAQEFDGEDHAFTTQGAGEFALPDGRAWELVSPPNKYGALLGAIDQAGGNGGTVIQAAADGGAITYIATVPTEPEPAGYASETQVFSTRGADGWSSHDLTLPHPGATDASVSSGGEYRFFSEDLSSAIVQPLGGFLALSPQASEATAYLHSLSSGAYTPLVTHPGDDTASPFERFGFNMSDIGDTGGPCPPELTCGPEFVDATTDTKHVLLKSSVALTETSIPNGRPQLYEWSSGEAPDGQLVLVSTLPPEEGGGESAEGAVVAGERNAISSDGSRVFFSIGAQLYVHDLALGRSLRLDVPEAGCVASDTCGQGPPGASFQLASSDGSRVLFIDSQRLTADASGRAPDLYECVIVESAGGLSCELSDLTPDNRSGEPGGILGGVVGASEDGSIVYIVSGGVLENDGVPVAGAVPDEAHLYERHDGVTSLVAVLSGADQTDWGSLAGLTARVSPNGRYLAFMSASQLTGYDNRDALSGQPDEELYEFDAKTGRLACASCDPTGARPAGIKYQEGNGGAGELPSSPLVGGDRVWEGVSWLAADVPGWTPAGEGLTLYQSRYLSNSGRLFFNAYSSLVPVDVNGTWDVYEYEPEGVGSCTSAMSSGSDVFKPGQSVEVEGRTVREGPGCVGLITSGESGHESAFLEASATGGPNGEGGEGGGDVFFLTTAKLTSQDYDDSLDVYDAHECTAASPCVKAPTSPPPCENESSCKASPEPQPSIYGSPASATFSGPGNLTPPVLPAKKVVKKKAVKCPKGETRNKRHKCVAKKKSKKSARRSAKGRK